MSYILYYWRVYDVFPTFVIFTLNIQRCSRYVYFLYNEKRERIPHGVPILVTREELIARMGGDETAPDRFTKVA